MSAKMKLDSPTSPVYQPVPPAESIESTPSEALRRAQTVRAAYVSHLSTRATTTAAAAALAESWAARGIPELNSPLAG